MKSLKKKISITLDENIIKKITLISETCDRSLSQYIHIVLKEHLDTQNFLKKDLILYTEKEIRKP